MSRINPWLMQPSCACLNCDLMFPLSWAELFSHCDSYSAIHHRKVRWDGPDTSAANFHLPGWSMCVLRQPVAGDALQVPYRSWRMNVAEKMSGIGNSSGVTTIHPLIYHVCEKAKKGQIWCCCGIGTCRQTWLTFVCPRQDGYICRSPSPHYFRLSGWLLKKTVEKKLQVSWLHLRRTDSSVSSAVWFDAMLEIKSTLDENEVHCLSALPLLEDWWLPLTDIWPLN